MTPLETAATQSLQTKEGTTININISTPSSSPAPVSPIGDFASEVDRLSKIDRLKLGVDSYTEAKIKLHVDKLKALLENASSATKVTQNTRDMIRDSQVSSQENHLANRKAEANALLQTSSANQYTDTSPASTSGILGTNANTSDGSGTSMIAGREMLGRLLNKSMKNVSGDAEIRELVTPDQEYSYGQ